MSCMSFSINTREPLQAMESFEGPSLHMLTYRLIDEHIIQGQIRLCGWGGWIALGRRLFARSLR